MILSLLLPAPAHASRSLFSGYTSIDQIQKRLAKIPENRGSRKKAVLHSDLGTLLYKKGEMEAAAKEFETSLTYATTRRLRRHIYLFMGKSYESYGRLDRAITAYEEALDYDPHNWKRHRDLANLYEEAELYQKARDGYADARALNPREPSLYFDGGRILRKMGLYKDAEVFLWKAREMGHDKNAIHREMSLVNEHRGRPAEALAEWKAGAGASEVPEDIARWVFLAWLAGDAPEQKAALKRLKGSAATPETVHLYENLVQLGPSALETLLSSRGKYPEIEAFVGSYLADRRAP